MIFAGMVSCGGSDPSPTPSGTFSFTTLELTGTASGANTYTAVSTTDPITVVFSDAVDRTVAQSAIEFVNAQSVKASYAFSFSDNDRKVTLSFSSSLNPFSTYSLRIQPTMRSASGVVISTGKSISITTGTDSGGDDDALLNTIQQRTFKYFWDFGHPVSGMARERSSSGDIVTTGGTGFGIMAMVAGVHRNYISRADGVARVQKIVTFLKNNCTAYHGAYAHWINGSTGATQPFSTNDNGADLVETSFLMQGLLTARQYFNGAGAEQTLRDDINALWNAVEWSWFRKQSQDNVLYWHWSPDKLWTMNMPIRGWNECLITYILAASSTTYTIPKAVYDQGWANGGAMESQRVSYGGYSALAGKEPLFFAHYSFLGLDPRGLSDAYVSNYMSQNTNHAMINYTWCVNNPNGYTGYSANCWGLTASDGNTGYSAHSPNNDRGVIAPTAAVSSIPYTPTQSKAALKTFYYGMGANLWKEYGFVDAFNLSVSPAWYDSQFLAIDQGPIVVMIENYRSGLLWDTFMSCPEITAGLTKLGFSRN